MTHQEVLASIESLPKDVQLAIVSSVLDRLRNGPLEVSADMQAEFARREETFLKDPHQGESWDLVQKELFGP